MGEGFACVDVGFVPANGFRDDSLSGKEGAEVRGAVFPCLCVFVGMVFSEVNGAEDHGGDYDCFASNDFSACVSGYDGWRFVEGECFCDVVVC